MTKLNLKTVITSF